MLVSYDNSSLYPDMGLYQNNLAYHEMVIDAVNEPDMDLSIEKLVACKIFADMTYDSMRRE